MPQQVEVPLQRSKRGATTATRYQDSTKAMGAGGLSVGGAATTDRTNREMWSTGAGRNATARHQQKK